MPDGLVEFEVLKSVECVVMDKVFKRGLGWQIVLQIMKDRMLIEGGSS
jgi:hypothetical protein